jgi:hypothetical protein
MAGSFITIFRWSIYSMSSLALIALWAFDPLSSEASFRGAYLRPGTGTSQGHAPDPPKHPNVTVIGTTPFDFKLVEDFMHILGADESPYPQSTGTEYYLADPLTAFIAPDSYRKRAELG